MRKGKLLSLFLAVGILTTGISLGFSSCDLLSRWKDASSSSDYESDSNSDSSSLSDSESDSDSSSPSKDVHRHDYSVTYDPATCTQTGTAYYSCSCGDKYTQELPLLKHNYNSCVCSDCGHVRFLEFTLSEDESYYILSGHTIPESVYLEDYPIVIPSTYQNLPVKEISKYAFEGCNDISSVVIPDSVTSIGDYAFAYCQILQNVTIGKGVQSIGKSAFRFGQRIENFTVSEENTAYKAIDGSLYTKDGKTLVKYKAGSNEPIFNIPEGVTEISDSALYGCWNLESITLPNSLTTLPYYSISACPELKYLSISANTTLIEPKAIAQCPSLTAITVATENPSYQSIDGSLYTKDGTVLLQYAVGREKHTFVIPDTVVTIERGACNASKMLDTVVIPDSVTTIKSEAFRNCTGLVDIYMSDSITEICTSSFEDTGYYNDESNWEDGVLYIDKYLIDAKRDISGAYTVKKGTILLADNAFNSCKKLTEITVNASIIGKSAFLGCDKLQKVVLGDDVTTVKDSAFSSSDNLLTVTLGRNVTTIEDSAFSSCYKLAEIYNKSPLALSKYSTLNGYIERYAKAIYTEEYVSKISVDENGYALYTDGDSVCLLGYLGDETDLVVPTSVTEINENAFRGDTTLYQLTSIVLNENLKVIGEDAFYYCKALTKITIPESVTTIKNEAFAYCSNLSEIKLGNNLTTIAPHVFRNTAYYNNPENWENQVLYMGKYLIYADSELMGTCTIKEGTTYIAQQAFSESRKMTEVIIADSVTTIDVNAFSSCNGLLSVTLGKNVTSIEHSAFAGCNRLAEIYNKSDLPISLGASTYGYIAYTAKAVYTEPYESKISIDENGFVLYTKGDTVTLIHYIGTERDIVIPESVTIIDTYAFYNTAIHTVVIGDNVTQINDRAFYYCKNLARVEIGNGVKTIAQAAFSNCNSLGHFSIGTGVKILGASLLNITPNLKVINYAGTMEEWNTIQKSDSWKNSSAVSKIYCSDGIITL